MTTGERLRQIITNQGVTIKDFCSAHDIHYYGLIKILSDERQIGINVLQQIKDAIPQMDSEWVLFGTERSEIITKYDNHPQNIEAGLLTEPPAEYLITDPVEEMFLQYLDKESIQEKIKKILNLK